MLIYGWKTPLGTPLTNIGYYSHHFTALLPNDPNNVEALNSSNCNQLVLKSEFGMPDEDSISEETEAVSEGSPEGRIAG